MKIPLIANTPQVEFDYSESFLDVGGGLEFNYLV
jgi:hypothetical protein